MSNFVKIDKNKKIFIRFLKLFFLLFFLTGAARAETSKPQYCPQTSTSLWTNCFGISNFQNGDLYAGMWKDGLMHGIGSYVYFNGNRYLGGFKDHQRSGSGIFINKNSEIYIGEYKSDKRNGIGVLYAPDENIFWANFSERNKSGSGAVYSVRKKNLKKGSWYGDRLQEESAVNFDCQKIEKIYVDIKDNLNSLIDEYPEEKIVDIKKKIELISDLTKNSGIYNSNFCDENLKQARSNSTNNENFPKNKFFINVVVNKISEIGEVDIDVFSEGSFSSMSINGEKILNIKNNPVKIKKLVRAAQETELKIVATDIYGNTDTKTITVSRPITDSKPLVAALNPAQVKQQPSKDAVAIIIGIADYKNLPRADYANDDARVFYDYAIRALGVKPENIKLLVDADADEVGIYRAFKTWLPSRVRASTDVYVYYSGHGLPTADGQGLYVLPQRADRDFIDKTAITQAEINAAIQATKPKSVTIFLDACYSGQARSGETLLASARPVALKVERQLFPDSFTVISASQADQISSSSPELKHGIFSYYLMRGMEGDADMNRDGKITAGEMHTYLTEQVARQAGMMNRQQVPQLVGDANRVLVGR